MLVLGETYLIKIEGIFIRNIKNTWWVSQSYLLKKTLKVGPKLSKL